VPSISLLRRYLLAFILVSCVLPVALPRVAHSEDKPAADTTTQLQENEKSPGERAQDKLKELNKECLNQATGQMEYNCAIRIYHDAGNILREANIEPDEQPRMWWTIYEGLGLAFAQVGRFEKAREFFQIAGKIERAGTKAREESAYNLGAVEYELGNIEGAIHVFDVLFGRSPGWVKVALRDPVLEQLRRRPEWKKMVAPYEKQLEEDERTGTPQGTTKP